MIQSGGFLGKLLGSLLKTGLPLMKNVIKPLAKSVLIQKWGFLSMLLRTLGASFLGNILARPGINTHREGVIRAGYRNKRQDHKNKMDF